MAPFRRQFLVKAAIAASRVTPVRSLLIPKFQDEKRPLAGAGGPVLTGGLLNQ
jgi:hypothetical protein